MIRKIFSSTITLLLILILVSAVTPLAAYAESVVTQTFTLHPGWNAIFLEVEPNPNNMASAFNGVPISSVWTWNPRGLAVQYIQNPSEALIKQSDWRAYFPPSRGEDAFLTNLFNLQANRAYLVEITGNNNVTWTISGVPSLKRREWIPDSFNLTGFAVDPNSPPAFGAFFTDSKAHVGQAIYRLNNSGTWEFVQNLSSTNMRSGEAFWIYTEGTSDYAGPLQVGPDSGYDLDFHNTLPERILKVKNISSVTKTVSLKLINPDAAFPLLKFTLDDNGMDKWVAFGPIESVALAPGKEGFFRLSVRRADMTTEIVNAILEISDGAGALYRIPISAGKGGI